MPGQDYIPPMTEEQKKIQDEFKKALEQYVHKRPEFMKNPFAVVDPEDGEE